MNQVERSPGPPQLARPRPAVEPRNDWIAGLELNGRDVSPSDYVLCTIRVMPKPLTITQSCERLIL
jgi:hypothetical protein